MQATMIMAGIFAALCFGVAINGFLSLGDAADAAQADDARGFAWFWTFLASVAAASCVLAWRMSRAQSDDDA
jgi:hypothetical protein